MMSEFFHAKLNQWNFMQKKGAIFYFHLTNLFKQKLIIQNLNNLNHKKQKISNIINLLITKIYFSF